jgi:hypothetical protein
MFVAFWLELDNPFWAGTSAAVVCQPQLGASLRKGWFRMIGTVVGVHGGSSEFALNGWRVFVRRIASMRRYRPSGSGVACTPAGCDHRLGASRDSLLVAGFNSFERIL